MRRLNQLCCALGLFALSAMAYAGPPVEGALEKQATNWHAIIMFCIFVALSMGITYWASSRTKSTSDFYTAGGGITGMQNGLAIAGDYMSAATLLGLTALVYGQGFDGYLYMLSFFAGWPIILFMMAERLRNLGRFTFADITSFRLDQGSVRTMAAISSLTVVCFYLIAQMVGAGQLIKLLFGLDYNIAIVGVGILMMVYVTFGGMVATTWVQIIKACMLLTGGTLAMLLAFSQFGFSFHTLMEKATAVHKLGIKLMTPGSLLADPVNAISLGLGLMFGTAGLPHILMRFFTVGDAKEARKSVLYASGIVAYFFNVIFLMGLCAILVVGTNPEASSTDLRASLASVTVKKRIRMWGRPAVPNISAMPKLMAEMGSFTKLPGPMIEKPILAASSAGLPPFSAMPVLIFTASANMASGLKPKCASTMKAMNEAPHSSMMALMICTQVVAVMPPNST